jgi:predicted phosphodiesterase
MIGMNDIELMIIPDVHGRFFWKEPIKYIIENTDKKIVFLGDYVDPYDDDFFNENGEPLYENIGTINDMLKNTIKILKEIIALKKLYPDRIILLLGNHDCGYMISTEICIARYDRSNCREISKIFKDLTTLR